MNGKRTKGFLPPTFPSSTSMAEPGETFTLACRAIADLDLVQTLARFKISVLVLLGQFLPPNLVTELNTSGITM